MNENFKSFILFRFYATMNALSDIIETLIGSCFSISLISIFRKILFCPYGFLVTSASLGVKNPVFKIYRESANKFARFFSYLNMNECRIWNMVYYFQMRLQRGLLYSFLYLFLQMPCMPLDLLKRLAFLAKFKIVLTKARFDPESTCLKSSALFLIYNR